MIRCRCLNSMSYTSSHCKIIRVSSMKRLIQTTTQELKKEQLVVDDINADISDMKSTHAKMKKLKQDSQYRDAINSFETFKKQRPNNFSYSLWLNALDCYAKVGQLSKMMSTYRELQRGKHEPLVYNILIKTFGKRGRLDDALEIYKQMKENGYHPDTFTYSALMTAHAAAKQKDQVIHYFQLLREHPDYKPSIVLYTLLIKHFANEGDVENIKKYHDMLLQEVGITDSFVFGTMLQGYDKAGDVNGMISYYCHVKAQPYATNCFTAVTMKMLMESIARHDMQTFTNFWKEEDHTLPLLQQAAVHVFVKHSTTLQQAMQHLADFENLGCVPSKETFNLLFNMASKHNDEPTLILLWNKMHELGIKADSYAYNAFLSLCVAKKDVSKSLTCFDQMLQNQVSPDTVTYNKMMELFLKQDRHEELLQFWHHMQERHVPADALSYKLVLPALRALGDLSTMQELIHQMKSNQIPQTVDILMTLLDTYAIHGTVEDMLAQYQDMESAPGITFERTMYHPIMYRFGREGNIDALISYLELMMQAPGNEDGHPTIFQHFLRDQTIQHINRFYTTWKAIGLKWEPWMWEALIQKLLSLKDLWTKEHCQSFCKLVAAELRRTGGADMELLVTSLLTSTASQQAGAKPTHLQGVQFYHLLLAVQATILQEPSTDN